MRRSRMPSGIPLSHVQFARSNTVDTHVWILRQVRKEWKMKERKLSRKIRRNALKWKLEPEAWRNAQSKKKEKHMEDLMTMEFLTGVRRAGKNSDEDEESFQNVAYSQVASTKRGNAVTYKRFQGMLYMFMLRLLEVGERYEYSRYTKLSQVSRMRLGKCVHYRSRDHRLHGKKSRIVVITKQKCGAFIVASTLLARIGSDILKRGV